MRTRKTNRNKSYAVEKYDFDGSSDEEHLRRVVNRDDNDGNFNAAGAAEESAEEEEEEDVEMEIQPGAVESEGVISDLEDKPDKFASQRVKPITPFNVRAAGITAYLDMEPVADGRIVRTYCGPYDRSVRGRLLVEAWFGRHEDGVKTAAKMLDRWMDQTVLPPKLKSDEWEKDKGIWSPNFFEREAHNAEHWYERVHDSLPKEGSRIRLSEEEARPYQFQRGVLPVLMGPHTAQREIKFEAGDAYAVLDTGLPLDHDDGIAKTATGWIFDAGGIVTGMDWAPLHGPNAPQLLALCVIPHSDQEYYDYEQESTRPDFQKHGVVQLWELVGERSDDGFARPTSRRPELRKTICFDYGRVRRVQWSPTCGFLAVLCDNGNVYVIEASDEYEGYERIQKPVASFGFPEEDGIKATTMTWINFNRLVIGYADGSIALWSIRPNRLLARHAIHQNSIIDMVSGYPAMPYLIASTPVGGTVKLLDLRSPSCEVTEVQNLNVSTQPNLLGYSDHMLGFYSMYPSAGVLNTQIGFMHHTHFPVARRVFAGESFPSCLSVGRTHPYLLIGCVDGSLWALNPQVELFTTHREPSDRIKVFNHEHRGARLFPIDSPATSRGVSRLVQGFLMERNLNPKSDYKPPVKKGKKPKKKDPEGAKEDEQDATGSDPTRAIVHEPLTRITVVEWNPNEEYGCWAAAAMGSGLVRVMDLGLEVED